MAQAMGQRRRQVSGTPEKIQSGDHHAGTQRIGPRITFSQKLAWSLAIALPLGFLGLFFAWPVASLVMRGLLDNGHLDLAGVGEASLRERTSRVVGQTLYQAAWATGISALAALPGAHPLYRSRFVGVGLLLAPITLMLLVLDWRGISLGMDPMLILCVLAVLWLLEVILLSVTLYRFGSLRMMLTQQAPLMDYLNTHGR